MNGTDHLMEALRRRYAGNAYAFFEQVRDKAGFDAGRTADAVAISLWPSRGLHLHGFEVKSDRRDWVREYRNPAKAESVNRYCDFWWLVVSDRKLVKDDELPETWGLMALKNGGIDKTTGGPKADELVVVKPAPTLSPAVIDRSFLACLLRRAYEVRPVAKELEAAKAEGRKEAEGSCGWRVSQLQKELTDLEAAVRSFEEASGLTINQYEDVNGIGRAVRLVLKGERAIEKVQQVEGALERMLGMVRREREQLGAEKKREVVGVSL